VSEDMHSRHNQLYQLAILQLQQQYQEAKQPCLLLQISRLYKQLANIETVSDRKQLWLQNQSFWAEKYQRIRQKAKPDLYLVKQAN
jgi:hypothetical protein